MSTASIKQDEAARCKARRRVWGWNLKDNDGSLVREAKLKMRVHREGVSIWLIEHDHTHGTLRFQMGQIRRQKIFIHEL